MSQPATRPAGGNAARGNGPGPADADDARGSLGQRHRQRRRDRRAASHEGRRCALRARGPLTRWQPDPKRQDGHHRQGFADHPGQGPSRGRDLPDPGRIRRRTRPRAGVRYGNPDDPRRRDPDRHGPSAGQRTVLLRHRDRDYRTRRRGGPARAQGRHLPADLGSQRRTRRRRRLSRRASCAGWTTSTRPTGRST